MKKIALLIFTVALCFSLVACANRDSKTDKYIGTYTCTSSCNETLNPYPGIKDPETLITMELKKDGTGTFKEVVTKEGTMKKYKVGDQTREAKITWIADEECISISFVSENYQWTVIYELKLNQLIDTAGDGFTYTKIA